MSVIVPFPVRADRVQERGPWSPFVIVRTPDTDDDPVASLGLDVFETGVLALFRHLCLGCGSPDLPSQRRALAIAVQRWGMEEGCAVMLALLPVLEAVGRIDRRGFRTMDPLCLSCRQRVTRDERALLALISAMRRGDTAAARASAAQLGEGRRDPDLLVAALRLASLGRRPERPRPA